MPGQTRAMQIDRLRTMLDAPAEAETWLRPLGFADVRTGHNNLVRLASAGVPLDLLGTLCEQFAAAAPRLADPDMALNNLERYILASPQPAGGGGAVRARSARRCCRCSCCSAPARRLRDHALQRSRELRPAAR